jgi:putative membrane protein
METAHLISLFKTIHIIGFVSWFAALFYLVRLFVYHKESEQHPHGDVLRNQYTIMENRLYNYIGTPSLIITWAAGLAMIFLNVSYYMKGDNAKWMHLKLLLVVLLTGYHHMCKSKMRKLQAGTDTWTGHKYRVFNEIATIFMIAIVSLAVFGKAISLNYMYWAPSILVLSALIIFAVKAANKKA